ncbi:MAG: TCP-1/cpn60 chaperonin family protein, partial [Planctomycetota bacterium]|nr:TCP-1/cpn60 chaperonin family protein [Planctomycetota bacterium]
MPKRTPKQIAFDLEAQMAAKEGVEKLSRAVKSTLGPVGSNAVIDRGWGEPIITKDGASVADEVDLVDPYENMAAKLVREAAEKTANEAGDGSTTATLLAESIFKKGLQNVIAGMNPMILSRGIRMAVDSALESLKELSTPVKSKDQLVHLATVAANQDSEIGQTIADAFESVGEDGVITIEEGKEVDTQVESVEGMEFDRGYLSPHFITDEEKMICELEKPYILIFEEKLTRLEELLPLMEKVLAAKRSLLIVAEDVEGEVL